jgi:hypothetical protein
MTTLAIINSITNVCENISLDDRPVSEIQLPEPYFVVDLDTTTTLNWTWDTETNALVQVERIGSGGIGYTWDGTKLIEPTP